MVLIARNPSQGFFIQCQQAIGWKTCKALRTENVEMQILLFIFVFVRRIDFCQYIIMYLYTSTQCTSWHIAKATVGCSCLLLSITLWKNHVCVYVMEYLRWCLCSYSSMGMIKIHVVKPFGMQMYICKLLWSQEPHYVWYRLLNDAMRLENILLKS